MQNVKAGDLVFVKNSEINRGNGTNYSLRAHIGKFLKVIEVLSRKEEITDLLVEIDGKVTGPWMIGRFVLPDYNGITTIFRTASGQEFAQYEDALQASQEANYQAKIYSWRYIPEGANWEQILKMLQENKEEIKQFISEL